MSSLSGLLSEDPTQLEHAEQMAREALKISQRLVGIEQRDMLDCMKKLANVLTKHPNKFEEARQVWKSLIEIERRVHGKQHVRTLLSHRRLVTALKRKLAYHSKDHPELLSVLGVRFTVLWDEVEKMQISPKTAGKRLESVSHYQSAFETQYENWKEAVSS